MALAEELEALAGLRDRGVLTEAEFELQKSRLLESTAQPAAHDAGLARSEAPPSAVAARSALKKTGLAPALVIGGVAAAVLALVAVRLVSQMKPSPPAATGSAGQASPDAAATGVAPAGAADGAAPSTAAGSTAAPSNWCTPGVRLNVQWSANGWYAATVKRPAEGGLCVVGFDGWPATSDQAIPVTKAAPEGSQTPFTSVGQTASAVAAANPDVLSVGVYECNMPPIGTPMMDLQWGILDRSTYSDFEGGRGSYTYDAHSGEIDFTSGSLQGRIRRKDSSGLFHVVEADKLTSMTCPYSAKDPTRRHW